VGRLSIGYVQLILNWRSMDKRVSKIFVYAISFPVLPSSLIVSHPRTKTERKKFDERDKKFLGDYPQNVNVVNGTHHDPQIHLPGTLAIDSQTCKGVDKPCQREHE
jgi:hypothetical protein